MQTLEEPLMYKRLPELIELTFKLGINSTLYTFAYRNEENLNKYRELLHISGCIGQKIIANYTEDEDKLKVLRKSINSRVPKCMR